MRARRQPLNNPNMPRACTTPRFRQFLTDAESRSRRASSAGASGQLTPIPWGKREGFVERAGFSPNKNGGGVARRLQNPTLVMRLTLTARGHAYALQRRAVPRHPPRPARELRAML